MYLIHMSDFIYFHVIVINVFSYSSVLDIILV